MKPLRAPGPRPHAAAHAATNAATHATTRATKHARALALSVVVAASSACLLGCPLGTSSREEIDQTYPLARMSYLRPDAARRAFDDIEAAAGGPFKVTYVNFMQNGVTMEVQDPRTPTQADSYAHSYGVLRKPDPKKDWRPSPNALFALAQIDVGRLVPQAKAALAAAAIPGAHVQNVGVRRSDDGRRLEVSVAIDGPRASTQVTLDHATGAVLSRSR